MHHWWQQTTWVVLVPITTHIPSFINVAHTELWIFVCFVISQSEQICKWGIKYAHSVTTDHVGSTCAPTSHISSLMKIGHCILIRERRFTFDVDDKPTYSVHPSVQTAWQMKTKWSFQHSWRPTKCWFLALFGEFKVHFCKSIDVWTLVIQKKKMCERVHEWNWGPEGCLYPKAMALVHKQSFMPSISFMNP